MKTLTLIALFLLVASVSTGAEGKGLDTKVSVNFLETELSGALKYLSANAKVQMIADPAGNLGARKVTVKLADATVRTTLTMIATTLGLAWDERWGGVFVATKERLEKLSADPMPLPAEGEEKEESQMLRKRMADLRVSFDFDQAPVTDCLEFVRSILNLNIVVDDAILTEVSRAMFSGTVSKALAGDALAIILVPRGLTADIRHGVVFVHKAGEKKPAEKPAVKKDLPAVFDETKLVLKFVDTGLDRVLDYLRRQVKSPIHLDPAALAERPKKGRGVSINTVKEITARQALDLVVMATGLDWDLRWGVVFVASKERLASLPKATLPAEKPGERPEWEVALRKALAEKRVSFVLGERKLLDVLNLIRDRCTVNILMEPKAAKAAADVTVTLRLEDRPLVEALALLLIPRGYTFDLAHEMVVVRLAKPRSTGD